MADCENTRRFSLHRLRCDRAKLRENETDSNQVFRYRVAMLQLRDLGSGYKKPVAISLTTGFIGDHL